MESDELDAVLDRFEDFDSSDEDDYRVRLQYLDLSAATSGDPATYRDKSQELWFGLSHDEKYEFLVAFRVIAGPDRDTIPSSKVYDLMLAMGFTLESSDITR